MSKCVYCEMNDAEPNQVRCEPCLVRDMQPEVRFVYERVNKLCKAILHTNNAIVLLSNEVENQAAKGE